MRAVLPNFIPRRESKCVYRPIPNNRSPEGKRVLKEERLLVNAFQMFPGLSNLEALNAVLYVAEQGCKWRGLPARFGNWHTIYTRMNSWAKSGILDRVFEKLQMEQIVRIRIEAFSLDSTAVKVHPDGPGAF